MNGQRTRRERWTGPVRSRIGLLVMLTAFWVALWGAPSWGALLGGILLAVGIGALRPPTWRWRVTGRRLPRLLWVLVRDLAVANIAMARAVIFGGRDGEAVAEHVVTVPLRHATNPLDGLISLLVTLTPGSISLGITRSTHEPSTLTIHALGFSPQTVTQSVHALEEAVCAAVQARPTALAQEHLLP